MHLYLQLVQSKGLTFLAEAVFPLYEMYSIPDSLNVFLLFFFHSSGVCFLFLKKNVFGGVMHVADFFRGVTLHLSFFDYCFIGDQCSIVAEEQLR